MLNFASLVVSLAVLLVAAFSVYAVSLRHANVEVDPTDISLDTGSWIGAVPTSSTLNVAVLVSNDGARGALIQSIRVADMTGHELWELVSRRGPMAPPQFPIVLAANESRSLTFFFPEIGNRVDSADESVKAFAERVAELSTIELVVEWQYIRSSGLPFATRLLPPFLRRGRRTKTRIKSFPFAPTPYRTRLAQGWRNVGRSDLADLVDPES